MIVTIRRRYGVCQHILGTQCFGDKQRHSCADKVTDKQLTKC